MNLQRLWWSLGVLFVALAIVVCVVPVHDVPTPLEWNDKVSHLAGHGALALYFSGLVPRRSWWKVFVFLLVMGIGVEFLQHYTNWGREADPRDVLANSVGALLGLALGRLGAARWPEFAEWLLGRRATQ